MTEFQVMISAMGEKKKKEPGKSVENKERKDWFLRRKGQGRLFDWGDILPET